MKRFLRSLVIHLFALWFVAQNIGGVDYQNSPYILTLGALALTITDSVLKPIINIFLLPFNLVTLGVFRWVSNVVTFYIATLLVSGFSIVTFTFKGLATPWFIIPEFYLSTLWAYVFVAFVISFITSLIFWIIK